jgi:hypothetical protein
VQYIWRQRSTNSTSRGFRATWQYAQGRWHGGPIMHDEQLNLETLDPLEYANIHVHHVVRATCGDEVGLGGLEQLVIGPYELAGLLGLLDGA